MSMLHKLRLRQSRNNDARDTLNPVTFLVRLLNFHVLLIDTQLIIIILIGVAWHLIDNFHVRLTICRHYDTCNITRHSEHWRAMQYLCLIRHFDIADYTRRTHAYIRGPIGACVRAAGFDRGHVFLRIS